MDKANGDLISLKAAIELIRTERVRGDGYSDDERVDDVVRMLESLPIVDAVPVVHGRWIPVYEEMETLVGVYPYTQVREVLTGWSCSVCGRCEGLPREEMPYCHCGAKMDLEEKA